MPVTKCANLPTVGAVRAQPGGGLHVVGGYDNGSKFVPAVFSNDGDPRTSADWVERDRAHNPAGAGVTSGKSANVTVASWLGPTGRVVTNFGHSLSLGFPWGDAWAAGYELSVTEGSGAAFANLARGGSVAAYPCSPGGGNNSGYARVLQAVRSGAPPDERVYVIHVGIADATFWAYGTPGASFAVPYGHAITTMVSRLVSDRVWEVGPGASDGDLAWTWSGTWVDAGSSGSTANGSGNGCRLCMADGSYGQATLPDDWGGGTLVVGFVHSGQGHGATWRIELSGANTGTYTFTQGADDADTGQQNGQVKRITDLNPGATTVKVTMIAHVGFLPGSLDYLAHEMDPAVAPEVILVEQGPLAPSALTGLSNLAGHAVLNSHFAIATAYLHAIAEATFAAFPSVHVVANGVPPDNGYVWITGGDGIHYTKEAYALQGRSIVAQAQRLMDPDAQQLHALYTRTDATGLYYGRFSTRPRAWDSAAATQIYATATPGAGKFCGAATDNAGSQAAAYVPAAGNAVKYKSLSPSLGWSAEADLSSAAQTVTQVVAGPDRPAGRGHFFWQETTTPAVRHRAVESLAAVGAVQVAASDPHATWTASLSRPVGYLDDTGARQLAVLYANTGPLWRALRFASAAAPSFAAETVTAVAVPTGAVAPALAAYEGVLYALLTNSYGVFTALAGRAGWRLGEYVALATALAPFVAAYRRPDVPGGPVIAGVLYLDLGTGQTPYWEVAVAPGAPQRMPQQFRIAIGGADYAAAAADVSWSSADPGGFESFTATLPADVPVRKLDRISVDVGGSRVWEGRVRELERGGGGGRDLRVTGEGYKAALDEQQAAYMYIDRSTGSWGQGTNARTVGLLAAGYVPEWAAAAQDLVAPTVEMYHSGTYTPLTMEAWFDAGPLCAVGRLRIGQVSKNAGFPATSPLTVMAGMAEDDVATTYNQTALGAWDASMDVWASTPTRRYGLLQVLMNSSAGADGDERRVWWRNIAILGRHGLQVYVPPGGAAYSDDGLDPGDIVAHLLGLQQAPIVAQGRIDRTAGAYVIRHASWKQPVPLSQMIGEVATQAAWTWGVWASSQGPLGGRAPVLDFHPPVSDATLTLDLGEALEVSVASSVAALYNREIVTYDAAGGAPGAQTVTRPIDDLDLAGVVRTETSSLGPATAEAAALYGSFRLALADAGRRGAGSLKLPSRVRTPSGADMPAYLVRAGKDRVRLTDLSRQSRPSPLAAAGAFRVSRCETTVANAGLETRIEIDVGADLLEVLTARLGEVPG